MNALGKDVAAILLPLHAFDQTDVAAGGAGDNAQIVGSSIDLLSLATHAQSVAFVVPAEATLGQDETLTVTADIQQSADGSTWSELVASQTILTLTGGTGGSTEKSAAKIGADLTKGDRYVRVRVTPDLSRANTDTAKVMGAAVFGGLQELPQ